jgi:hypothetical protein
MLLCSEVDLVWCPVSDMCLFCGCAHRAAKQNYPNSQYNFTWMVEQHGADMGTHANMWRISQDIGE